MTADQVKQIAHQMRMFGIHACAERRAQEALTHGQHPLEFLRLLLEDEVLMRKDLVSKRLITRARFRLSADVEDWDKTYDRGVSKAEFTDLASCTFFHHRENLILLGKTGVGKTHLAEALGRKLCREGISVRFLPVNFFFEEITAERTAGKYLAYVKNLVKPQALILDDWGLRSYTHTEATALVDLLEERYQKGSILLTSQVDPKGWKSLFEDPVIAEAITDRLIHPSRQIVLKGPSYRERLGKASRPK